MLHLWLCLGLASPTFPLYDSSDHRRTALHGYTPTPLPLQTFLSPPVRTPLMLGVGCNLRS